MESSEDISIEDTVAILAINERDRTIYIRKENGQGLTGGSRTPGVGVSWEFSAMTEFR